MLAIAEFGPDKFEIVVPSLSILAEPPVAMVDGNVDQKGTRAAAEAYLKFLYTPKAQAIIARNFYRPFDTTGVDPKDLARFPKLDLVTIDSELGAGAKPRPSISPKGRCSINSTVQAIDRCACQAIARAWASE
jgi:ABC-type sulfate transport system substrate-binding protein